jgi:hypothetical protein
MKEGEVGTVNIDQLLNEIKILISKAVEKRTNPVLDVNFVKCTKNHGLLNEPVKKYEVITANEPIQIAVKIQNLNAPPEKLFRQMYENWSHRINETINLKLFDEACHYLTICNMPKREAFFYNEIGGSFVGNIPDLWSLDIKNDLQFIIMENLCEKTKIDKIEFSHEWLPSDVEMAIRDLAFVHSRMPSKYDMPDFIPKSDGFDYTIVSPFMNQFHKIVSKVASNAEMESVSYVTSQGQKFIDNLKIFDSILSQRAIVIHNDFNIRNVCISRKTEDLKLKIYDWEFMAIGSPMMDIVDFLLSLCKEKISDEYIRKLLILYCNVWNRETNDNFCVEDAIKLVYICALKFASMRMNMYLLCYANNQCKFIQRMYSNLGTILKIYEGFDR